MKAAFAREKANTIKKKYANLADRETSEHANICRGRGKRKPKSRTEIRKNRKSAKRGTQRLVPEINHIAQRRHPEPKSGENSEARNAS